jgi:hypothetical protein
VRIRDLLSLVRQRLVPNKLSLSRAFRVKSKKVQVSVWRGIKDDEYGVTIKIVDNKDYDMFTLLTSDTATINCAVFDTKTTACTLFPPLPNCKGCPLSQ